MHHRPISLKFLDILIHNFLKYFSTYLFFCWQHSTPLILTRNQSHRNSDADTCSINISILLQLHDDSLMDQA